MDSAAPKGRDEVRRVALGRLALVAIADPVTRAACDHALGQVGMIVTAVASGVEAVIAARRQRPDLMLLDAQLEDVPGRQAADWLRGNPALAGQPLVLLVDSARESGHIELTGPTRVLRKPVSDTVLIGLVGTLLSAQDAD